MRSGGNGIRLQKFPQEPRVKTISAAGAAGALGRRGDTRIWGLSAPPRLLAGVYRTDVVGIVESPLRAEAADQHSPYETLPKFLRKRPASKMPAMCLTGFDETFGPRTTAPSSRHPTRRVSKKECCRHVFYSRPRIWSSTAKVQ